MEIVGDVKNYDWGKVGANSIVSELAALNSREFFLDPKKPYAELWMGAHPSGPSTVKKTGAPLDQRIADNIPFLFKVLSIRKALSIQVHPNKTLAERLHRERPDIYKDPNHKPELAIALTPFLALCGFRPYEEIYQFCQELPPLKRLVGGDALVEPLKSGTSTDMRNLFERLVTAHEREVARCILEIARNFDKVLEDHGLLSVFESIGNDFPLDCGLLAIFFLNLIRLQPGQAIFLGANEIHAYLSGDCIECMACSDNVIRAGLTTKYKDVPQLLECVNYTGLPSHRHIFQPHRIDSNVKMFVPPVEDFAVIHVYLPITLGDYRLQIQPYSSIMIVLQGERKLHISKYSDLVVRRGSIIYIPPEAFPEIEFLACEGTTPSRKDFIAYIAIYNSFKSK